MGGGDARGLIFEVKKASFQLTEYCRELLCLAGRSSFGERDRRPDRRPRLLRERLTARNDRILSRNNPSETIAKSY